MVSLCNCSSYCCFLSFPLVCLVFFFLVFIFFKIFFCKFPLFLNKKPNSSFYLKQKSFLDLHLEDKVVLEGHDAVANGEANVEKIVDVANGQLTKR